MAVEVFEVVELLPLVLVLVLSPDGGVVTSSNLLPTSKSFSLRRRSLKLSFERKRASC